METGKLEYSWIDKIECDGIEVYDEEVFIDTIL